MLSALIIASIAISVAIGYKTKYNTGLFAIVFAYLIGCFALGMKTKAVIGTWPVSTMSPHIPGACSSSSNMPSATSRRAITLAISWRIFLSSQLNHTLRAFRLNFTFCLNTPFKAFSKVIARPYAHQYKTFDHSAGFSCLCAHNLRPPMRILTRAAGCVQAPHSV